MMERASPDAVVLIVLHLPQLLNQLVDSFEASKPQPGEMLIDDMFIPLVSTLQGVYEHIPQDFRG